MTTHIDLTPALEALDEADKVIMGAMADCDACKGGLMSLAAAGHGSKTPIDHADVWKLVCECRACWNNLGAIMRGELSDPVKKPRTETS